MSIDSWGFVREFMSLPNNAQSLESEWHNINQLTSDETKILQQKGDTLFKDYCPYTNTFDKCEDRRCLCKKEQSCGE